MFIKLRKRGERAFKFLTPKGGETSKRVHASIFDTKEAAQEAVEKLSTDNPAFEFKVTS